MKRVMVFGTFDQVHPGHLSFFRQAKRQGDTLIVVVARDKFVKEAKGKIPRLGEKERLKKVRKIHIIDKAVLGSATHNFYRTIRTYKPNIIALGYDQKPTLPLLKKDLKKHRLANISLARLRAYKPNIYKSSKLWKNSNSAQNVAVF